MQPSMRLWPLWWTVWLMVGCEGVLQAPTFRAPPEQTATPDGEGLPTCDATQRGRSQREMRRLTLSELSSSMREVFGEVMAQADVASAVLTIPPEAPVTREVPFDNRITDVEGLATVAERISRHLVTNRTAATTVLRCDPTQDVGACQNAIIEHLGPRLFRRPLSPAEQASYRAFMSNLGGLDGVEWGIARLLVSPHFHHHLELEGTPAEGRRRVDAFAVASRLAFGLTGTLPDEALLSAAANHRLDTLDQAATEARRLLESPAAQRRLRELLSRWTQATPPDPSPAVAAHAGLDARGLGAEANDELDRFIDDVVFAR